MIRFSSILRGCFLLLFPSSFLVSCGRLSGKEPNAIKVSVRAEDYNTWNKVAKQFEDITNKNGNKVKIKLDAVSDMQNEYAVQNSLGNLPDLAMVDKNFALKMIRDKINYFRDIDLDEIQKPIYDVMDLNNQKKFDFRDDKNFLFTKYAKPFLRNKNNKILGLPFGAEGAGFFVNNKLINNNQTIKFFSPNRDGTFDSFDTKLLGTKTNIQKFIDSSGKANDDFDKNILNLAKKANFDISKINDYGPLAMHQRISSIALSLTKGNLPFVRDFCFPFGIVASQFSQIYKDGMVDDSKLQEIFPTNLKSESDNQKIIKNFSSLFPFYGYYVGSNNGTLKGIKKPPSYFGEAGEAEVFGKSLTPFLLGKKWQLKFIKGVGFDEKNLSVYSVPYSNIGMDLFCISKNIQGKKLENVRKLLRFFLSNENIATQITADKFFSPNYASYKKFLDENKNNQIEKGFANSLKGESYKNINGMFLTNSTKGIFGIYNEWLASKLNDFSKDNNIENYLELFSKFKSILIGNIANEIKKL